MGQLIRTACDEFEPVATLNAKAELTEATEKVVLLLDSSGSMGLPMPGDVKSRQQCAVEATLAILGVSDPKTTAYGFITFESDPHLIAPITSDYLRLYNAAYQPMTSGGTNMSAAISMALNQPSVQRIILLSDGEPDSAERALTVARTAKDLGVKIDTVGIGECNVGLMQEIARITGGKFQKCDTPAQLAAGFARLETRARAMLEHRS